MKKNLHGFSYSRNIAIFKHFYQGRNFRKNLYSTIFLRSELLFTHVMTCILGYQEKQNIVLTLYFSFAATFAAYIYYTICPPNCHFSDNKSFSRKFTFNNSHLYTITIEDNSMSNENQVFSESEE